MYTDKVLDHFQNPHNLGKVENPDGEGTMGSPDCGDYLVITFKVDADEFITDIKFQVSGCAAAIATSSVTTELAKGKYVYEALNITEFDIVEALDGLPYQKLHCSVLGAGALKAAIKDYIDNKSIHKDSFIIQELMGKP